MRPDTYMQSMGQGATPRRCLVKDREKIRTELMRYGSVMLINDIHDGLVFRYIPRGCAEYNLRVMTATRV